MFFCYPSIISQSKKSAKNLLIHRFVMSAQYSDFVKNYLPYEMPAVSAESAVRVLRRVRSPIANYQEQKGISKLDKYSFLDLMHALCQHAYNAGVNILTMLYNLLPLFEGFVFLVRFILDKMIEIFEAETSSEQLVKLSLFIGELLVLGILLYFIITFLLLPIVQLILIFAYKIFRASLTN